MPTETLGTWLRHFRQEADLGQEELGQLLGYSHSQISRFENDKAIPPKGFPEKFRNAIKLTATQYEQLRQLYDLCAVCEHQKVSSLFTASELIASPATPTAAPIPDVSVFYGREPELIQLSRWIQEDKCRWVGIIGLGGVGKTMLAAKLAQCLQKHYQNRIIWCSLRDAPLFIQFLRDLYEGLTNQRITIESKEYIQKECLAQIQKNPYLIIIDNLESILQSNEWAGHYLPGYELYDTFFKQFSESVHQSCLLMTSREKPCGFASNEGPGLAIRSLQLGGLDPKSGQKILQDRGISGGEEAQNELIDRYSGNPLAIKMIAEVVFHIFGGKIDLFLSQDAFAFCDIESLFSEQIRRLSALQLDVLYWLMIFREPVRPDTLYQYLITGDSLSDVTNAVNGLVRRSLVETNSNGVFLQNVLLEFLTAQYIAQTSAEIINNNLRSLHSYPLLLTQSKQHVQATQKRLFIQALLNQAGKSIGADGLIRHLCNLLNIVRGSRLVHLGANNS